VTETVENESNESKKRIEAFGFIPHFFNEFRNIENIRKILNEE
jgi:hypothetical protein